MSIKQFVWNLAGMESMIPEEDLPEADETLAQAEGVDETNVQDQSPRKGSSIPLGEEVPLSGRTEQADGSVGAFFSSLVGGTEEDPTTPILPSPEATPKQEKTFIGALFSSEKEPEENPQDTTGEQKSFFSNLLGSSEPQPAPPRQDPVVVEEQGFIASLFGSRPVSPVIDGPAEPEEPSLIQSLLSLEKTPLKAEAEPVQETFVESLFGPSQEPAAANPPQPSQPAEPLFINPQSIETELPAEISEFVPEPAVVEEKLQPPQIAPIEQDEEPSSPLSFFGTWFGSPTVSPPPLQKVIAESDVEKEPESDAEGAGFGSFLVSLVAADTESPKQSILGQLANELASPMGSMVLAPPASLEEQKSKAAGFDDDDAEDEVRRIEKFQPRSNKLTRLLVSDKAESEMRLQEAEAAMKILREIRDDKSQSSSWNIFKLPEPLAAKPAAPSKDAAKVSEDALKKANEVLKSLKPPRTPVNLGLVSKGAKILHRKPKVVTHRPGAPLNIQPSFDPLVAPFSERLRSSPSERGLSFSKAIEGSASSRPSVVVTSVEVRKPFILR